MLKVAVVTKPPQQGSDNEITKFRAHIQQYIEQELEKIEDVKIVDLTENGWVYYIEITFSLCKSIEDNLSQSKSTISAQIVSANGLVDTSYNSVLPYTMNRLPVVCATLAELFNDICLEKVRNECRKPNHL